MRIDQAGLPAGEAGFARRDGLSNGATVTLRDTTEGGLTIFEILWVDPADTTSRDSLAPTGDDHIWTFQPTSGVTGPIRIRLTHTSPEGEVTVETRIFGIPDADGQVPPAPGERADPNATLGNATDPEIIAACERNWKTDEWPEGNPFGWSFDVLAGPVGPTEPTAHVETHMPGDSDALPLATTSTPGLMSIDDKTKLDGLGGATAPTPHVSTHLPDGDDALPLATSTVDGLMRKADKSKLDGLGGPVAPTLHVSTHLLGGADALPLATSTVDGLMRRADKIKLDGLGGATAHAWTHVSNGGDTIPVATQSVSGLMSINDKIKLDGLGGTAQAGPHALTHMPDGEDPIAEATQSAPGLMSLEDKIKLDSLAEPELTLLLNMTEDASFAFDNVDEYPRGLILAQQDSVGERDIVFTPPASTDLLIEKGSNLTPNADALAYTLYEYNKVIMGRIVILKRELTKYFPPPPFPDWLFNTADKALASRFCTGKWSVQEQLGAEYTGPLFRVRRAGDNAEMDIGYNNAYVCDEAALAAFCAGNQGYVCKLYNQGYHGNALDFEQTNLSSQPLIYTGSVAVKSGSQVMMQFDGVDDYLTAAHRCGLNKEASGLSTDTYAPIIWMLWKPAAKDLIPNDAMKRVRVALAVGTDQGSLAFGAAYDRIYALQCGLGYSGYLRPNDGAYSCSILKRVKFVDEVSIDSTMVSKNPTLNTSQDPVYTSGGSDIGRSRNTGDGVAGYAGVLSHTHYFLGGISTILFTYTGGASYATANSWDREAQDWLEARRLLGNS